MQAGRLNRRLSIYSLTRSDDGAGGFTSTETLAATVWADIRSATPSEVYAAGRLEQRLSHVALIRARPRAAPVAAQGMRVTWTDALLRSRAAYVEAVSDADEDGRTLRLDLREGGPL